MVEEMKNIDPVSGNEVPVGAKPEEVRDDVPIMASEGEYVVPADVVRYIGLDRIEKMVKQAKKGLMELDAEGRIGGEKATMDEDLPFSPEELMAVDEGAVAPSPAPAMMAEGGMVTNYDMDIDPATGLPKWLLAMQQGQMEAPKAEAPKTSSRALGENATAPSQDTYTDRQALRALQEPRGLAKPVNQWSTDDYSKYAKFRTSPEASIMKAGASLVPFGGIIANVAQRSTERQVNQNLSKMLSSGKDLNGNPLSTDQLNTLRETYSRVTGEPISRIGGLAGVARSIAQDTGLVKKPTATQEQIDRYNERVQGNSLINRAIDFLSGSNKPRTKAPETAVSAPSSAGRASSTPTKKRESAADKQLGKTPTSSGTGPKKTNVGANNSKTKTTSTTTKSTSSSSKKSQAERAGFAKGGLIKKRNK